jgi:hypothetical protein
MVLPLNGLRTTPETVLKSLALECYTPNAHHAAMIVSSISMRCRVRAWQTNASAAAGTNLGIGFSGAEEPDTFIQGCVSSLQQKDCPVQRRARSPYA